MRVENQSGEDVRKRRKGYNGGYPLKLSELPPHTTGTDFSSLHFRDQHFEGGLTTGVFSETVAKVRAVEATPDEVAEIARGVISWPVLPAEPTEGQRADQRDPDAELVVRRDWYFRELGTNAHAAFNLVTDSASHPP